MHFKGPGAVRKGATGCLYGPSTVGPHRGAREGSARETGAPEITGVLGTKAYSLKACFLIIIIIIMMR